MKQVSSVFLLLVWLLILSNTSYGKSQEPDVIHPKSQPFEILYVEDLPEIALQALAEKSRDHSSQTSPLTWSFEAFGKAFQILLHPNNRLIAKIPQEKRAQLEKDLTFYRGTLEGITDSWVRLTRSEQTWSGMIWDGHDAYIIDSLSVVTPALRTVPAPTSSQHSIYRISDTRDLGNRICGMEGSGGIPAHPMTSFGALMEELEARVGVTAQGATRNIDMAVVTDQEFNRSNSNPNAAVIARMNIVDGIFSEQLGVQISLVDLLPLPTNGGLTSTNARTLLNQFGQFSNSASFDHPGIAHLFTGRNLDGRTVGIAYFRSLCSARFGVGVDQITGTGAAGALTVAHELGHNFGAPHDNEDGSPCSATPGTFLMNPVLNGSDQFSPCSMSQIQPAINGASCLTVINTSPPPPPSSLTISNLTVASGNVYVMPASGLQVGATVYRDRSYTFRAIPANVQGATYIQTANNDKAATTANFLSFRVNQPVAVYIAHDLRITPKPSWLSTFTDTGTNLVTSDTRLRLFVRSFPAGTITLGGNRTSGTGASMYSVLVKAAGGSTPPPPPPPSSLTISNLTVASGTVYVMPASGLQVGSTVYRDRSYTFRAIPANVQGATYIQTANNDKAATTANFLSFRVNQPVAVYIAHDLRITPKPSWLSTFTDTGTNLVTSDTRLRLFVRSFPAGTITLGGNRTSGTGASMYSVLIKAAGGSTPPPPPPPSSLTISNLTVASGTVYVIPASGLQVGATVYRDRSFTFRAIPANVQGAAYIQTANNDKAATTANFLRFTVNQPVTVSVGHDVRITPKPSWLSTFTDTGTNLVTSDTTLRLFVRSFPAGTITLGGNRTSGTGGSMYAVLLKAEGGGNPPPPPPSSLTISNLTVASGTVYVVPASGLQVGATVYRDRSYTFRAIPANVQGAAYIQTANNDKAATTANFLRFTVNQPVTVSVGHDVRITPKPSWLSTFTDTGTNLVTSDTRLRLFVRSFPAGTITLGGNRVSGTGGSMYAVIVK